jgi:hypothetical protein
MQILHRAQRNASKNSGDQGIAGSDAKVCTGISPVEAVMRTAGCRALQMDREVFASRSALGGDDGSGSLQRITARSSSTPGRQHGRNFTAPTTGAQAGRVPRHPGTWSDAHQPDEVVRLGMMVSCSVVRSNTVVTGGRGTHSADSISRRTSDQRAQADHRECGPPVASGGRVVREQLTRLSEYRTRLGRTAR